MPDDLYDQDFYLWTRAQAEALRAHGRGANMLDYENLAEEIESLGSSERGKCASLILRILQHLFELHDSRNDQVKPHWCGEVRTFRADLDYALTRAIRIDMEADLESLHRKAARVAADKMRAHEPGARVDATRRWSLAQCLGEIDDPLLPYEPNDEDIHEG
jgi:hypothetical protein